MILELTSSFDNLFKNIQKNVDYLNYLLDKQMQSMFYLEMFQNGILYVYKDFEILKSLNLPLTKRNLTELQNSDFKVADFYLNNVLDEKTFPETGITIYYRVIDEPKIDTVLLLKKYFESYNNPEIQLIEKNSDTLQVKFCNFHAIRLYAQRLGRLRDDLMKNHQN